MILKAIKILPYLLPTTANVTMGVLNKQNRAVITPRTVTLQTTQTTSGKFMRGSGETYTVYRAYNYYDTSVIGTFLGQSVSTTEMRQTENETEIYWGREDWNGNEINLNPKNVSLIRFDTAWLAENITLKNIFMNIGITPLDLFTDPYMTVNTYIGLMRRTETLDAILETNWTLTKNTMNDVYYTVQDSLAKSGSVYRLTGQTDHWNEDDLLWDSFPNGTYPNLNEQIYLQAGERYYIGIITELEWKNRWGTEISNSYWNLNATMTQATELEVYIQGETVINYPQYDIVDIPGLMFTVLTMPFSFISQAFNVTLFPNSIYSVNVSGIFLSIIALLVFAWIIKLVLRTLK